jgi:hypothetical protein
MRIAFRVSSLLGFLLSVGVANFAGATLIENFDGSSSVPYTLTSSSGSPPAITAGTGTNKFARLANLNASNSNSIAFDVDPATTGPQSAGVKLAFDFRMTGDEANNAAGGCCASAADGLGVGLFAAARYGATGGVNPANGGGGETGAWERPNFQDAFTVGLDVFQNIDVVSINWADTQVAEADVAGFIDLNNDTWHRALVTVKPDGANALVDMQLLEDVDGNTEIHNVFSNLAIPGLNVSALPDFRLIAGARTGGAFLNGDIDNIAVVGVPEPTSIVMTMMGGLLLAAALRRKG